MLERGRKEWVELEAPIAAADSEKQKEEIGDVFFTFVNLARFLKVHPETALTAAINKFVKRFKYMEAVLAGENKTVEGTDFDTLNALWEKAKESSG